ncbi:hypothetical protein BN1079_02633 [Pseudomonas saudiphocaensis]|uniref:Uncharacterized protein n=1 Tax=Pseudomonas saudiphocaensis TaxID=1499686 RepID=A0A078LVK9_9PSED|nr:hypothetical protein BN1079_02633 [Pseudomonas saudiphocaensis]
MTAVERLATLAGKPLFEPRSAVVGRSKADLTAA